MLLSLELGDLQFEEGLVSEVLGRDGLEKEGKKAWRKAVFALVPPLQKAFLADYVVLGGGKAEHLGKKLPPGVRLGKLRQDQFAFEDLRVLDVVMMGHTEMWAAMSERDAIYANPEASEDDYMRAADLEAKFAEFKAPFTQEEFEKRLKEKQIIFDLVPLHGPLELGELLGPQVERVPGRDELPPLDREVDHERSAGRERLPCRLQHAAEVRVAAVERGLHQRRVSHRARDRLDRRAVAVHDDPPDAARALAVVDDLERELAQQRVNRLAQRELIRRLRLDPRARRAVCGGQSARAMAAQAGRSP